MIFHTRQEANNIRRSLCQNTVEATNSDNPESTINNNGDISENDEDDDVDIERDDDDDIDTETTSADGLDTDIDKAPVASSEEILGYIGSFINSDCTTPTSTKPAHSADKSFDVVSMNAAAVHKQESDSFFACASRTVQSVLESSAFSSNILNSKRTNAPESPEFEADLALATYIQDIVGSSSFLKAKHMVDDRREQINPRKRTVGGADVHPLEREVKQRRNQSYASI
jgi:hypothetical protein